MEEQRPAAGRIACPGCGKVYKFEERHLGKKLRCPACAGVIPIPLDAEIAGPSPPLALKAPAGPAAPARAENLRGFAQPGAWVAPPQPPAPAPEPPGITAQPGGVGEPEPAPPAPPAGPPLPERMRANLRLAGRTCPGCSAEIELGQGIRNCQKCGTTHHEGCWDPIAGCASAACRRKDFTPVFPGARRTAGSPPGPAPVLPPAGAKMARPGAWVGAPIVPSEAPAASAGEDLMPCRFCGEPIQRRARKCRFCGEFQNEGERQIVQSRVVLDDSDRKMGGAEILFAIICSDIACIVGIVWAIQGKPKGGKMIVLSIVSGIIKYALISALQAS